MGRVMPSNVSIPPYDMGSQASAPLPLSWLYALSILKLWATAPGSMLVRGLPSLPAVDLRALLSDEPSYFIARESTPYSKSGQGVPLPWMRVRVSPSLMQSVLSVWLPNVGPLLRSGMSFQ